MPKGELNPSRKAVRVSAMPSPSASRRRVMRLALGWLEPARRISSLMTQPLIPLPSSGLGGASVSATSTSPLGRGRSQRGRSRPSAKAATLRPGAAVGAAPAGQPLAGGPSPSAGSGLAGRTGGGAGRPALGGRHLDRRQQGLVRRGELRVGAGRGVDGERGLVAAGGEAGGC